MLRLALVVCAISAASAQYIWPQCGDPAIPPNTVTGQIVGGAAAKMHSWPWQTEIIKSDSHYCGGTLINDRWIVSAAHCYPAVITPGVLADYKFSVGGYEENDMTETTRQTFFAQQIIRHENYNAISSTNDIALIQIDGWVNPTPEVSPACVSTSGVATGTTAWVTGWGDQELPLHLHDPRLQQVDVPVVSQPGCVAAYPQYNVDETMFCAGYPEGGKDSCQGDSGGPVVVQDPDNLFWSLIGIVSWGVGCADPGNYGVYTNVTYLEPWIRATIAAN